MLPDNHHQLFCIFFKFYINQANKLSKKDFQKVIEWSIRNSSWNAILMWPAIGDIHKLGESQRKRTKLLFSWQHLIVWTCSSAKWGQIWQNFKAHTLWMARINEVLLFCQEGTCTRIKDTHNLQHSSGQNENISFAVYFYSYNVYISEKENTFSF